MSPAAATVLPALSGSDVLGLVLQQDAGTAGWTLALLGLGVLLEGPVVTVLAGSLAGAGLLDWWAVWLVVVAADVLADTLFFVLGRAGRSPRAAPLLTRLGLTESRWEILRDKVENNLPRVVLGAKLVDIGAIPAFLAAGLAGVRHERFLAWVVPATAVRATVLVGIGALVGGRFAAELADRPWILVAAGLGVGLVLVSGRSLWLRSRPASTTTSRKENACVS